MSALFLGFSATGEYRIATTAAVMVLLCSFIAHHFVTEASLAGNGNPIERTRQMLKGKSPLTLIPGLALAGLSSWALWHSMRNWSVTDAGNDGEQIVIGALLMECICLGIGFSLWIHRGSSSKEGG